MFSTQTFVSSSRWVHARHIPREYPVQVIHTVSVLFIKYAYNAPCYLYRSCLYIYGSIVEASPLPSTVLIIGYCQDGRPGPAPGLHSGTSSSERRSLWRPMSTDASYARRMPNPKMNSFVILARNTQIQWGQPQGQCLKKGRAFARYRL